MSDEQDRNLILLKLVQDAVQEDNALREKHHMGEKFKFIRDRLHALQEDIASRVNELKEQVARKSSTLQEDEVLVYVYLYNAQGIQIQTWNKMVSEAVFYEYSINRPIYSEKSMIEGYIKRKPNRPAHGYLTVAVKKSDILPGDSKDMYDQPLIKIREGGLHINKLVSFTHNEIPYILNDRGTLIKKENNDN
jgi:hypothetical protein